MRFIKTDCGHHVPFDKIESLRLLQHEDLMDEAVIIKASPGYEFLDAYEGHDGGFRFSRTPIVAWRVDGLCALPVTISGVEHCADIEQVVLCPDGKVEHILAESFDSLEAWEEATRNKHIVKKAAE